MEEDKGLKDSDLEEDWGPKDSDLEEDRGLKDSDLEDGLVRGLRARDSRTSRCSASICLSYSAHMLHMIISIFHYHYYHYILSIFMDKVGINSHLRMSSSRSSLLAGLGGGCSEVVVGVFGGRAGGFPRGIFFDD